MLSVVLPRTKILAWYNDAQVTWKTKNVVKYGEP